MGEIISCCNLFGSELALSITVTTKETDSVVTLLGIYPIGLFVATTKVPRSRKFIVALFIIAKTRNNQNAKQRDWLHKGLSLHGRDYNVALKKKGAGLYALLGRNCQDLLLRRKYKFLSSIAV